MQSEATFAEIFEAELNCADVPHARRAWSRPLTTSLFVFELPQSVLERPRPAVRVGGVALGRDVPPLDPPLRNFTESPTRKIALSPLERRALVALNALGAGLDERLSPSTLRRAFRRLARRYHPDRHPGSSAAEQQRLARVFAEATAHYRVLAAALASSG